MGHLIISDNKKDLFFAATSDVVYRAEYKDNPALGFSTERENFLKPNDLYSIYSKGDQGWMAWAGGRRPSGSNEEGTIIGRFYGPVEGHIQVTGVWTSVKIRWFTESEYDVDYYVVYRDVSEVGPFNTQIGGSHFVSTGPFYHYYEQDDNSVEMSMPYWYKIKVVLKDNGSNRPFFWVGPFSATPFGFFLPPTVGAPLLMPVTNPAPDHGLKTDLTWIQGANNQFFYICRSETQNGPYEYIGTTTNTSFSDETGEIGRTYYYKVQALKNTTAGAPHYAVSDLSASQAGGSNDEQEPPIVTGLLGWQDTHVDADNGQTIFLSWEPMPWDNAHEPNLGGYFVCPIIQKINEPPPTSKTWPVSTHLNTLSPIQRTWYEDRRDAGGPPLGAWYYVCAIDRAGNIGEWSAPNLVLLKHKWYYVDVKTGSDMNPGTEQQPFATIQKAASVLQANEAVCVREGIYHESITPLNSGSADSGKIYYVAYPGEEVIITGDTLRDYGFSVIGKSHILISGFDIKDCKECGILYENSSYGEVWENKIHHNKVGIRTVNSFLKGRENTIVANDSIGVFTNLASRFNFGNSTDPRIGYNPGNNNIYANGVWNFVNQSGDSILAQNNYWGLGDSATIAGTISGPVIFMPMKTILPLDWKIQVKATSNFAVDTSNYAGVVGEASDSCDEGYDIPKYSTPPSDYVYLDFPHPEWNHPLGDKFCQDVRKTVDLTDSTMVWNFEVNTDKSSENITLTINPTDVPSGYGIYLLDLTTGTTQDMKSNPNYVYNSGSGGVREFQLSVGLRGINHGGADWVWTVDSTRTVYDRHYNIGLFKINPSAIMNVTPYDGVDTVTGKLRVESKTMEIVGTLSADSSGFIAESGPGAGVQGTSMHGASGAGYGGRGGHGGSNIQGDTTYHGGYAYGTTSSFLLGSGGGNSDPTLWGKGGRGAGAVKLKCSSSITLNGTLRANGKAGTGSDGKVAGGGSGGSLIIQTVSLAGTGTISAKGGDGAHNPSSGSVDGGGAAGGRINLTYTNSTFTGRIDVSGGEGPYNAIDGQPGTALVQSGDNNVALLSPVNTATNSDSRNGFIKGVELANTWIRLTANDTICGNVELSAQDSIIINSSSYIISSSKGYAHNQGTGYGHAGSSSHGAGGSGYGGIGGHGSYYTPGGIGDGGITYPDSLLPDSLGSGGGDYADISGYRWGGGSGGGKIKLDCRDGNVLINGTLQTNGANGISKTSYASGGGAGGSVLIYAKYLVGNGTIEANGGNGGAIAGCYAGGGAGGRICLYRDSTDFSGSVSADGGLKGGYGATDGAPGTINEDYIPYGGATQMNPLKKPIVFKLYQNYPNPFINKTTIKYSIPKTTKVSLRIYDISGRCVKTLVDGNKVPGYYKESLEARDYPTGIYFARFKTNEYKETKKMVLMR